MSSVVASRPDTVIQYLKPLTVIALQVLEAGSRLAAFQDSLDPTLDAGLVVIAEPDDTHQIRVREASRVARVAEMMDGTAPGLEAFTTDPLFGDLWLRPDLAPRDRSLVTVAALIANGQSAQLGGHLSRAMANGLTAGEAGEVVAHSAFYAGWPAAFSASAVVRDTVKSGQD